MNIWQKIHSAHSAGQVITLFTQFRPDYLFYLQKLPDPPLWNQLVVPKINQDLNEPSYETVTYYGQNNHIFGIFSLVDFLFSSPTIPNVFIVMVLKCTCILIIIYTFCTCDTLVPTRILNSEISWFCFDFPKWGPVSFIITDFNVFVQFFE